MRMGPYDDLIAELDHAAAIFGHRKVIAWCLEWAIAEIGDPPVAGGVDGRLSIWKVSGSPSVPGSGLAEFQVADDLTRRAK
jgi:hypothetical protein